MDQQVAATRVGSPPTSRPKMPPNASSFFAFDGTVTDEELRELAVRLALTGQKYTVLSSTIDQQENAAKNVIDILFGNAAERIESSKAIILEKIRNFRERITSAEARIADLENSLRETRVRITESQARKSSFGFKLQQARLIHNRLLWEDNEKHFADAPAVRLEEFRNQFEKAKDLHLEWEAAWRKDEGELQRRAEHYRQELASAKQALQRVTILLDFIKGLGVTRTIAGFLVWSGYLWLAGNAVVLSELLATSRVAKPSLLEALLSPLSSWISRTPFWTAFPLYLAASLVCVAAVGLLTLGTDLVLRKLNPGWAGTTWRREGSNQNSFSIRSLWSGLQDFFDGNPLATITKDDKKSERVDPTTRWTLLQTIAMLPSILIGFLLVFLLGAIGTNPGGKAGLPDVSTVYLSIVWSVVMSAVALLYTCHVIQFRWLRMNGNTNAAVTWSWPRRLMLNGEYVLMALAFLVSTVIMSSQWGLEGDKAHRLAVWPPILISFCLASLTLAYGMVLLGLFRDQKYSESRVRDYQTLIDETLSAPCLTDLIDLDSLRGMGREVRTIARTRLRELLLLRRIEDQYELEAERPPFVVRMLEQVSRHFGFIRRGSPVRAIPDPRGDRQFHRATGGGPQRVDRPAIPVTGGPQLKNQRRRSARD